MFIGESVEIDGWRFLPLKLVGGRGKLHLEVHLFDNFGSLISFEIWWYKSKAILSEKQATSCLFIY